MEIFIKLPSRDYEQLRERLPAGSSALKAIERATRIEHSLDGVQFEGYTISCEERDARELLDGAAECCPEMVSRIEAAIRLAGSNAKR